MRTNTLTGNLLIEYAAPRDTREIPVSIARLLEAELGYPIIRHTVPSLNNSKAVFPSDWATSVISHNHKIALFL